MTLLAFVWLVLIVVELTAGLSPVLETLNVVIWALFVLQFLIEFIIAPRKVAYLRQNWLTAISLVLPALRIVRIARVVRAMRAARGVRLVRVISSANRGMRTLGRVMGRRGLSYVPALTLLVNLRGRHPRLRTGEHRRRDRRVRQCALVDGDDAHHHGCRLLSAHARRAIAGPPARDLRLRRIRIRHCVDREVLCGARRRGR